MQEHLHKQIRERMQGWGMTGTEVVSLDMPVPWPTLPIAGYVNDVNQWVVLAARFATSNSKSGSARDSAFAP